MRIGPLPADIRHDAPAARPNGPGDGTSFSALLTAADTGADALGKRAFGFGEFGVLGLHALRASATERTGPAARTAAALPIDVENRPAPPGQPQDALAGSQAAAGAAAAAVQAPVAASVAMRSAAPTTIPSSPVAAIVSPPPMVQPDDMPSSIEGSAAPDAQAPNQPDATPWFSIVSEGAGNMVHISAALPGLDDDGRQRMRRRVAAVAAEYGVKVADFLVDGRPDQAFKPVQRS